MPKFQPPPTGVGQALIDQEGQATLSFKRFLETVQKWLSSNGAPKTSTSAGTPVQIQGLETDGTYLYVCVGTNSWKRILLSSF